MNHPSYLIDATLADIRALAGMGAYLEHSICMFVPDAFLQYTPQHLKDLIDAARKAGQISPLDEKLLKTL